MGSGEFCSQDSSTRPAANIAYVSFAPAQYINTRPCIHWPHLQWHTAIICVATGSGLTTMGFPVQAALSASSCLSLVALSDAPQASACASRSAFLPLRLILKSLAR